MWEHSMAVEPKLYAEFQAVCVSIYRRRAWPLPPRFLHFFISGSAPGIEFRDAAADAQAVLVKRGWQDDERIEIRLVR